MKLKYTLGIVLVVILCIVYYRYNPEVYHFFPECPFHKYTHLDCPGCGSQRAIHALLNGQITQAINYNLLLVLSLPMLLVHFSLKGLTMVTGRDYELKIWYKPITPKIIFALVMVFWIARNIPREPFLYLAA